MHFWAEQNERLDAEIVRQKFWDLAEEVGVRLRWWPKVFCVLRWRTWPMPSRRSLWQGYDITEYALNCFGGAAGQHAYPVADALGVRSVLVHRFPDFVRLRDGSGQSESQS